MAINTGRVVGGGIVAGIIMNGLDALWGNFVMKDEYQAMATRMGCDPPPPKERRDFLIDLLAAEFRRQSRSLG